MSAPAVRSMDRRGKSRCRNRPVIICLSCAVACRSSKGDVDASDSIRASRRLSQGTLFCIGRFLIAVRCQKNSAMVPGPECAPMTGSTSVDADVFDAETFADLLLEPFRIIDAIAMGDEDRLLGDRRRAGALPVCGRAMRTATFLRPRTFSKGTRCPSSSTHDRLDVEHRAGPGARFETRPPRHKNMRSSTVNQWARCSLFASRPIAHFLDALALLARWHACHTSRPLPPGGGKRVDRCSLRCGYSAIALRGARWIHRVPERPLEKPRYRMSPALIEASCGTASRYRRGWEARCGTPFPRIIV